jgi:hypothetical protein
MPKSKAKPKATQRASVSAGGGGSGSAPDPTDQAASSVLVTQFGQRYHRRLDCYGLHGARTIFGPYSACLLCANGL